MNCRWVQEQLSRWLDGELPEPELSRVADHLEDCPLCRRELELMQRLDAALADLTVPVPPEMARKVLSRLARPSSFWYQSLALAACLVLGIFLGGVLTGTFYRMPAAPNGNGNDLASLEVFQDFPQGSLGTLVSYPDEDANV